MVDYVLSAYHLLWNYWRQYIFLLHELLVHLIFFPHLLGLMVRSLGLIFYLYQNHTQYLQLLHLFRLPVWFLNFLQRNVRFYLHWIMVLIQDGIFFVFLTLPLLHFFEIHWMFLLLTIFYLHIYRSVGIFLLLQVLLLLYCYFLFLYHNMCLDDIRILILILDHCGLVMDILINHYHKIPYYL